MTARAWMSVALLGAAAMAAAPPAAAQEARLSGPASQPAAERLAGHGGPIKGLAVFADPSGAAMALTASFDYALGFWNASAGERLFWLDGHEAAVNAVAFTPDGAAALSASDDFTARYWRLQSGLSTALEGHRGKVAHVAVAADGARAATASWDGSIGLWRLPKGREDAPASLGFLEGHQGAVNAVAFSADGGTLFSGGADGSVIRWRLADGAMIRPEASHGFGVNVLALPKKPAGAGEGWREPWIAYGAADGVVRVVDLETGVEIAALTGDRRPILSLALSPSGARLAYGDGQGYITTVEVASWSIEKDFRAAARGPIWALAFLDEARLLAAGIDDSAAIWPVVGDPPPPLADRLARFQVDPQTVSNGERQFARKCSVCHTLTPGGARRAGPSLHGLFGRPIASAPDYAYSPELKALDIVWTAETVDKLFDIGPDHYTPGSKMPMQRITDPQDRADLIAYLQAATAPQAGAGEASGEAAENQ